MCRPQVGTRDWRGERSQPDTILVKVRSGWGRVDAHLASALRAVPLGRWGIRQTRQTPPYHPNPDLSPSLEC